MYNCYKFIFIRAAWFTISKPHNYIAYCLLAPRSKIDCQLRTSQMSKPDHYGLRAQSNHKTKRKWHWGAWKSFTQMLYQSFEKTRHLLGNNKTSKNDSCSFSLSLITSCGVLFGTENNFSRLARQYIDSNVTTKAQNLFSVKGRGREGRFYMLTRL